MLKNFFKLDEPYDEFTAVDDIEQHFHDITVSLLENVKFLPPEVAGVSSKLFKKKWFRNVSFSFTKFENVTFSDTKFEDCLFLYAEFFHCHFFNCQFINCNMHKIRLDNCYLDPRSFKMDKVYKKTAENVGTWLFQQLFMNSKTTHQPQFSGDSEILFKRWLRAQRKYEFWQKKPTGLRFIFSGSLLVLWLLNNILFDVIFGYGHRPLRFIGVSIIAMMIASAVVHYFWPYLGLVYNAETLDQGSYLTSIYYTTVVTTTLGFGDITPTTDGGRLVAIILPISGVIWLTLLAAVIIKRIIR